MIVRTRGGGHRELRMASPVAQDYIPSPAEFGSWLAAATGERITVENAASIPAVLNAIRLVAESTGSLPLRVYQGHGADKKVADASWQWKLLHERPNDEQSPFDFWHDVAASVETHGNAYILKALDGIERNLWLLDPSIVTVERDRRTFEKVFVVQRGSGSGDGRPGMGDGVTRLTSNEVLHVRGPVLKPSDTGLTPLQIARDALGSAIARHKYEGHLFRNDAVPPAIIEDPAPPNPDKARRTAAVWQATHGGANTGSVGVLMGGSTLRTFGLTMRDAQFVESNRYSVEDVGRMFAMPPSLLGAGDLAEVEQDTKRFLSFGLGARLKRIESALRADPDLFGGSSVYPEFYTHDFIRLDAATEAQVRHFYVQDGVLVPDEVRAQLGLPALPDGAGKIPQLTPVGGAPNPALNGNGASE